MLCVKHGVHCSIQNFLTALGCDIIILHYPLTGEETEAHSGKIICSRPYGNCAKNQDCLDLKPTHLVCVNVPLYQSTSASLIESRELVLENLGSLLNDHPITCIGAPRVHWSKIIPTYLTWT